MIVVLDNAASTFDFVTFDTRIEGCGFDSVYLSGTITELDYYIYRPSQEYTLPVKVDQAYDRCPLNCELIAVPTLPYFIDTQQTETQGDPLSLMDKYFTTTINTNEVSLDGSYIDLQIACESELANVDRKVNGVAYVTSSFRVKFYDACQFASIMPATRSSIDIPLYQESYLDLIQATTDALNCPTITNTITILSTSSENPTDVSIGLGPLENGNIGSKLGFNPNSYGNLGDYQIMVTSCISYGDGSKQVCSDGEPFTVSVYDPCPYTEINSSIFDRVMARPQLQTDTLNLFNELPIGAWTWPVKIDETTGGSYGPSLCGKVVYSVMTNEVIPQVTNLVTLNSGVLTFAPQVTHPVGTHDLLLVGTLESYPSIQAVEPFQVTVLPCEASLYYGAAQQTLSSQMREWGDPAHYYDISNTIAAYVQEPACGYPLKYTIWYENVIANQGVRFASQPVEA